MRVCEWAVQAHEQHEEYCGEPNCPVCWQVEEYVRLVEEGFTPAQAEKILRLEVQVA